MVRWFNDLAGLKRMLPRTGPAVAGVALVAVVAFLLGALLFDDG